MSTRHDSEIPSVVNLDAAFATIDQVFSPRIAGEVNDVVVKLARIKGEFIWHHHENEDELFLVVKGELIMRFRDSDVTIREGEFLVVPRGVEHLPVAENEVHVLLVEPRSTVNTGNVLNERTQPSDRRL